jgi:hypothetical protein
VELMKICMELLWRSTEKVWMDLKCQWTICNLVKKVSVEMEVNWKEVLWWQFCDGTGAWTQGLLFARQVLYYLSHSTSLFFVLDILKIESLELLAGAVLQLWSSWSLLLEKQGLQVWATGAWLIVIFRWASFRPLLSS